MKLILYKYISREIWALFFVTILVFIFIIMATRMMSITEMLIIQRVSLGNIFTILLCLLPSVILFSLPITCLICVLLTFLRLSSDNEVTAMHTSGMSLYQMMPPVILFSFVSYLFASFIAIYGVPTGNMVYRDTLFNIAKSTAHMAIKERVFFEPFEDVVFYVNSYSSRDGIMKDLFVVDKRGIPATNTIVAKRGNIISNEKESIITIRFVDGTIFTVDKDFKSVRTVKFETYNLNIDLKEFIGENSSREKSPKEMYVNELIHGLKSIPKNNIQYNQMGIQLFEMFSIPMAIFFMGIIGLPLGAHVRASGRTKGIVISLVVFLIYYVWLMAAEYLCEMNKLPPSVGVWFPVIFLVIACVSLIWTVANDRSLWPLELDLFQWFQILRMGPDNKKDQDIPDEKEIEAYIGSRTSKKVHRTECRWVNRISFDNRIPFKTLTEAIDRGYSPCNHCKPY